MAKTATTAATSKSGSAAPKAVGKPIKSQQQKKTSKPSAAKQAASALQAAGSSKAGAPAATDARAPKKHRKPKAPAPAVAMAPLPPRKIADRVALVSANWQKLAQVGFSLSLPGRVLRFCSSFLTS
jgi:hypothetical protein